MGETKLKNQIRRLRFDHDEMTQQELAQRVGVTRQTIIAIEHRKYAPSLELAFRIARAFGKRVEEVFQHEEEPSPTVGTEAKAHGPDSHL
jgi:putative transcriptional regulator